MERPIKHSAVIKRAYDSVLALDDADLCAAGGHDPSQLYAPVITYPAMSMMKPASVDSLLAHSPEVSETVALYVHIPFCITRCLFCHWVVKLGSDEDEMGRYLECLNLELVRYRERLNRDRIAVSSILVGGGTPSLLGPGHIERFIEILQTNLDLSGCKQFSFEGEPSTFLGDLGAERLRALKAGGVDRISMGVQSFEDELLKKNARHHTAKQARESIERIHEFGIESVSIDMIYGLTGQTLDNWVHSLEEAIASGADAWQLYRLRIAPCGDRPGGVVRHASRNPDQYSTVDQTLVMKMLGIEMSENAGFLQHYTRIFARGPEHISYYLHDVNARLSDVIGVGISSWGNIDNTYLLNIGNDFPRYFEAVEGGGFSVDRGMVRNADEEARHAFILQLKNWKVDYGLFRARTGRNPRDCFGGTIDKMLGLRLISEDEEGIALTERGRFYADQVVAQFTSAEFFPSTDSRPETLGSSQLTA